MEKRGLGIGLGALIPEREAEEHFHSSAPKEHIRYIPVEQIKPNPYQPRENFDSQSLEELVASIIKTYNADIVGLQEALKIQLDDLTKLLPDFTWVGVGRDDGAEGGEYSAIFYSKKRVTRSVEYC